MLWRPLSQPFTFVKLPVTRSRRVYSYLPDEPRGCQPVRLPAQSRFTSAKPLGPFVRTTTRFVSEYVGSVKKTYDARYSAGGTTFTNSGSPRPDGVTSPPPVM